jgi:integrase
MLSLTQILKTEYDFEYKTGMIERQYILPKIYHGGKDFDLSKRWYVYYSYRHPDTGLMVRQPAIYMNVNRDFSTAEERLSRLKLIQKNLKDLLKKGFSPYPSKDQQESCTIKSALDWAFNLKQATLSDSARTDYSSRVKKLQAFLARKGYDVIDVKDFPKKYIFEYFNELIVSGSAKSFNNHKSALSSIFTVLKDNEMIPENYISSVKNTKAQPKKNKTFSDELLNTLLENIQQNDPQLLLFINFISYNVLRPVEVVRLKWNDLKLNQNPSYLEVKAKNKPLKVKIIPSFFADQLRSVESKEPTEFIFVTNEKGIETKETNKRNFFSKKFKVFKDELNLGDEYTMYSFRHTFITKLYREIRKEKTELETYDHLMKITGHTTLDALKAYLRDIDAELADDYSKYLNS